MKMNDAFPGDDASDAVEVPSDTHAHFNAQTVAVLAEAMHCGKQVPFGHLRICDHCREEVFAVVDILRESESGSHAYPPPDFVYTMKLRLEETTDESDVA